MVDTPNSCGAVINLSSVLCQWPYPFEPVYSSTKAFIDFFTRVLYLEHPQIDVLSLRPGYVSTPLTTNLPTGGMVITPNMCATAALAALGKCSYSNGHLIHRIFGFVFTSYIPLSVIKYFKKL